VYAAAVHHGRSPATVIEDSPIALAQVDGTEWTPQNYDGKFEGPMTMRRGLYDSRNLIAIKVGMDLGEETVVEMARRFGLTTPIPPYPSIHIGSAEVYPLQLVAAYTAFANLGVRTSPNAIVRVEDQEGNVLWQPEPKQEPVLTQPEAWLMVSMLKDVVLRGTAAARVWGAGFRVPSAGKTGTTNEGADVWYVGFTADLVAGVWMGFDKPKKIMSDAQGGRLAAPAYTSFMTEVYRRKPEPPDWPRPASIIARQVDSVSGLLAASPCADRAYVEYFLPGTEPHSTCTAGVDGYSRPTRDTSSVVRASTRAPRRPVRNARDVENPFRLPPE
jgi:penicillin-binding protein 1A